jgi:hypothetical protein
MLPAFVVNLTETDDDKGMPSGFARFLYKSHVGLFQGPSPFASIAGYTGTDYILPGSHPPPGFRKDMVQIQFFSLKFLSAILTSVPISLKDILAGKLHLVPGQTVVKEQENNAGDFYLERDRFHDLIFLRSRPPGKILPVLEAKSTKSTSFFKDYLSMAQVEERKPPLHRADIDCLPETI